MEPALLKIFLTSVFTSFFNPSNLIFSGYFEILYIILRATVLTSLLCKSSIISFVDLVISFAASSIPVLFFAHLDNLSIFIPLKIAKLLGITISGRSSLIYVPTTKGFLR